MPDKDNKTKSNEYKNSKLKIQDILYYVDPIGLVGAPKDEYSPEAELIIKDMGGCGSVEEIYDLLVRVFIEMFNENTVGEDGRKKLHIAAKIFFDRDLMEFILTKIQQERHMNL